MENNKIDQEQLIAQLNQAVSGLLWLSESDYPWQVVSWQNESNCERHILRQRYNYPPEIEIATTTLDSFFASAILEQEWHDEIEQTETKRYQILYDLLNDNLEDLRVFLVGKTEIDVFVLGKLDRNTVIGLSTKLIAT
ncbi:nuclease A inhibitor family protein [Waterburya agarophytonicola K14]|uniref:Nuclease A inhibitor family protein n=1 Tax=Waterburya agarophytonicola KI4 TaxID=2874699 RepID=A0A964BML7_9CYAN|nr:nuclease A inhibitor family protein [Waterburya agarophytonicola]MCC0175401.1 nuclease A inhibitor family protein [Waterburya agarophytonicola KI4]